jgi:GDP-L-fucose synthase
MDVAARPGQRPGLSYLAPSGLTTTWPRISSPQTVRVFIAGGRTLLGAALIDSLRDAGYEHLVGTPPNEPDLTRAEQVEEFFQETQPEYVVVAAGLSGGIRANQLFPAALMRDNLLVTTHVLAAAHRVGVRKLLYVASSCGYPKLAPQPLREDSLLTGPLEPTSECYALAKLAGLKLCQAYRRQYDSPFIAAIPANPYGPHDDFSPEESHVIPGLLRRMHTAKQHGEPELSVWGTGAARREFIHAHDLAAACWFLLEEYDSAEPINVGTGVDVSIAELAQLIAEVVGYRGRLRFDATRPDGMPLKALDSSKLRALGWRPAVDLRRGLEETYKWFLHHVAFEDVADEREAVSLSLPYSLRGRGDRQRLSQRQDQEPRASVNWAGGGVGRRV